MQSLRLHDIERNTWRMMHRDGLMDVLFGFMLLGACVSALVGILGQPEWLRLLTLVVIQFGGVAFMVWMRWREVAPRIGRVKFSSRRARQTRTMRIILGVCVAVTVLLVVATTLSNRLGFSWFGTASAWTAWLTITAVLMIPIGALALFMDYPRLLLYGALFVAVEFCLIVLELDDTVTYAEPILYGAGSLIGFSIGIPVFVRFLRLVPRHEVEEDHNE
jgi:hypothetical protein